MKPIIFIDTEVSETDNKELKEIVESKSKDFVDSIDKLGIQNTLRKKLEHDV